MTKIRQIYYKPKIMGLSGKKRTFDVFYFAELT